jgi:hypothetical protein
LLAEHKVLQDKIPTATKEADERAEQKQNNVNMARSYINQGHRRCREPLILRSARVLANDGLPNTPYGPSIAV